MRYFLGALSVAVLLLSCSSDEPVGNVKPILGWTNAGLSVDVREAESSGTGIECVAHVGEFLFARNDRRMDGENRYQLFLGKAGSLLWKVLELPEGDVPGAIFADSSFLYVGTFFSRKGARLWRFDPRSDLWNEIPLPVVDRRFPIRDSSYGVDGIAKFRGRLVLSISHGVAYESVDELASVRNPIYFERGDGSWVNADNGFPAAESFIRAREWNGSLYAMTYGNGVYRFEESDASWHRLSAPFVACDNGAWNDSSLLARDAVPSGEGLLVGYANLEGMFSLSPNGNWKRKSSCSLRFRNGDAELVSRTPPSVYRFVPFKNKIVALGEGSAAYFPAEDAWLDIPAIPGVSEILDGFVFRDTLYVAAFQKGVMKLSLSFLDSASHFKTNLSEVIK